MPSTSSIPFMRKRKRIPSLAKTLPLGVEGITIVQKDGGLVSEIKPILSLIAEHDVALASSHVSPVEALALVKAAR